MHYRDPYRPVWPIMSQDCSLSMNQVGYLAQVIPKVHLSAQIMVLWALPQLTFLIFPLPTSLQVHPLLTLTKKGHPVSNFCATVRNFPQITWTWVGEIRKGKLIFTLLWHRTHCTIIILFIHHGRCYEIPFESPSILYVCRLHSIPSTCLVNVSLKNHDPLRLYLFPNRSFRDFISCSHELIVGFGFPQPFLLSVSIKINQKKFRDLLFWSLPSDTLHPLVHYLGWS